MKSDNDLGEALDWGVKYIVWPSAILFIVALLFSIILTAGCTSDQKFRHIEATINKADTCFVSYENVDIVYPYAAAKVCNSILSYPVEEAPSVREYVDENCRVDPWEGKMGYICQPVPVPKRESDVDFNKTMSDMDELQADLQDKLDRGCYLKCPDEE